MNWGQKKDGRLNDDIQRTAESFSNDFRYSYEQVKYAKLHLEICIDRHGVAKCHRIFFGITRNFEIDRVRWTINRRPQIDLKQKKNKTTKQKTNELYFLFVFYRVWEFSPLVHPTHMQMHRNVVVRRVRVAEKFQPNKTKQKNLTKYNFVFAMAEHVLFAYVFGFRLKLA